jgi:uncharacterized membrane protein
MKENFLLRKQSYDLLEGRWMISALIFLVYTVIMGAASSIVIGTILLLPLTYSIKVIFLDLNRGQELNASDLFGGFKDYGRILLTMLLTDIYIFLWSLLFVIPGIIKYYSYSMVPYVLRDYPDLSFDEAIEQSMHMMSGFKSKLFMLDLSFIGWAILCVFTLGIGFFWLIPYVYTNHALFYEDLQEFYEARTKE